MILRNSADQQSLLEDQFERRRFTRRTDLTNGIRLTIATNALHAKMNGVWGAITNLADKYQISRPFVYSLADTLKEAGQFLFREVAEFVSASSPRELSIQIILSLRLETRSSIGAISTVMNRFGHELSSTGSISQILSRIGGLLPTTISAETGIIRYLVFASDEIFSKTIPILVTVDPCSSAILRIELTGSRKAEDWKKHFECLYDNGVEAIYLVSDEGKGIRAGHAGVMSDVVRQSDTYHAIAHQLGSWMDRLEKAAYKAIGVEHECERKLVSAKSDKAKEQRGADYEKSAEATKKAVTLYDDFSYLYRCVLGELNVFDSNGNLRKRQQAEEGVTAGLALVEELNHNNITKAVNKIKRTLPDLFHYFEVAKKVVNECKKMPINEEILKVYCIAWQWGKAVRKAKKTDRKEKAREREQFCLEIAEGLHQQESEDIQKGVYSKLDKIVQSSALVECINSIIRPYLNTTKNHVTQEMLNLIMHYHNHRRYCGGVRKGKTPMEILTGEEQAKDWIAILFDMIREKDQELLFAP
jgi:acyl-CoA-binding protein